MALFDGDVGGVARVVAEVDDCLAVVYEEDVDVFGDCAAASAFGGGGFFGFGEDVDAVSVLEHGRERGRGGPPLGSALVEVEVCGDLAVLA